MSALPAPAGHIILVRRIVLFLDHLLLHLREGVTAEATVGAMQEAMVVAGEAAGEATQAQQDCHSTS